MSFDSRILALSSKPTTKWVGASFGGTLSAVVAVRAWCGLQEVTTSGRVSIGWLLIPVAILVGGESVVGVGYTRAASFCGDDVKASVGIRVHFLTAPARILCGLMGSTRR